MINNDYGNQSWYILIMNNGPGAGCVRICIILYYMTVYDVMLRYMIS